MAVQDDLLFGTVDSWLIWNLTGGKVHVTDVSNASRTMLYNIKELKWDEELLDKLEVPRSSLPEVKPSSGIVGVTDKSVSGMKPPSRASPGTSRPRSSARPASRKEWSRTPTGPDASC